MVRRDHIGNLWDMMVLDCAEVVATSSVLPHGESIFYGDENGNLKICLEANRACGILALVFRATAPHNFEKLNNDLIRGIIYINCSGVLLIHDVPKYYKASRSPISLRQPSMPFSSSARRSGERESRSCAEIVQPFGT